MSGTAAWQQAGYPTLSSLADPPDLNLDRPIDSPRIGHHTNDPLLHPALCCWPVLQGNYRTVGFTVLPSGNVARFVQNAQPLLGQLSMEERMVTTGSHPNPRSLLTKCQWTGRETQKKDTNILAASQWEENLNKNGILLLEPPCNNTLIVQNLCQPAVEMREGWPSWCEAGSQSRRKDGASQQHSGSLTPPTPQWCW